MMVLRSELPIDDIKGLIETGDISLQLTRDAYTREFGHPSALSDDDVIACHAAQDDDYGMTDIVHRMAALEARDEATAFKAGECVGAAFGSTIDDFACLDVTEPVEQYYHGLITADEMRDKLVANLEKLRKP